MPNRRVCVLSLSRITELSIQPQLNSTLIPPHARSQTTPVSHGTELSPYLWVLINLCVYVCACVTNALRACRRQRVGQLSPVQLCTGSPEQQHLSITSVFLHRSPLTPPPPSLPPVTCPSFQPCQSSRTRICLAQIPNPFVAHLASFRRTCFFCLFCSFQVDFVHDEVCDCVV